MIDSNVPHSRLLKSTPHPSQPHMKHRAGMSIAQWQHILCLHRLAHLLIHHQPLTSSKYLLWLLLLMSFPYIYLSIVVIAFMKTKMMLLCNCCCLSSTTSTFWFHRLLPYAPVICNCSVMIFMSLMIMINDGKTPSFCEIRLRCIIASRRSFSTKAYWEYY
jgi:hypothetical protein